ncbi:MAG: hypothetical protein KDB00_03100 [Planctomycetales bacterium]|nr:hypothetical protein [Planctomycetales bacterium]
MQSPSVEHVRLMAKDVSNLLDEHDSNLEDDDPVADWPSEIDELVPVLLDHLKEDDWYAGLSDCGKAIWERAFTDLCENQKVNPFKFKCESDGVYWNIVGETIKYHGQPNNQMTDLEITHFGTRPLKYWQDGKLRWDDWHPMHSMHTPQEVEALIEQFSAAEDAIRGSRHEETESDYEELMPVLDRLRKKGRALYVSVDT